MQGSSDGGHEPLETRTNKTLIETEQPYYSHEGQKMNRNETDVSRAPQMPDTSARHVRPGQPRSEEIKILRFLLH